MTNFKIKKAAKNSNARTAVLKTAHGNVNTPVFCPVGTAGALKGLTPRQVEETGAQMILANTYHLMLRPGIETVQKIGGLHKLMAWQKPILTDSGGYQVFSLSTLNKITDNGVEFASHIDGKKMMLTPQLATEIQNKLGSDIAMAFDECPPHDSDEEYMLKAVDRTIKWAKICKDSHKNPDQLLFGIVQGGCDPKIRKDCAQKLVEIGFDGYALGGLGIGEGHDNMINAIKSTIPNLPQDKPRYLMGVGMPADIIAAVKNGIDIFDCVLPTRNGRNAFAFTNNGPVKLRNSKYTDDTEPIDKDCDCYCCKNFSRASLRHFFNISEMLGPILVSIHNISFLQKLMANIAQNIENDSFDTWADEKIAFFNHSYNSHNSGKKNV